MRAGIGEKLNRFIMVIVIALAVTVAGAVDSYALELHNPENSVSPMVNHRESIWEAVRYGSYPQTEIVASGEQSGAYDRKWSKDTDFIVDATLYEKLQDASYDSRGDATVDGVKYRRVRAPEDYTQREEDYFWDGTPEYHYFRYEPVKWLVLAVSDGEALLLSEKVLGYTPAEAAEGWARGEFSEDALGETARAELLAVDDVANTDRAVAYGFQKDPEQHHMVRCADSSTYAKACGCRTSWISSNYEYSVASWVLSGGSEDGYSIVTGAIQKCDAEDMIGVRPAVRLNVDEEGLLLAGKTRALGGIIKQEQAISGPEEVSVAIGETCSLGASACTKLSYSVDDDEVASVAEDGVITPKKTGTTIVKITADDTEEFSGTTAEVVLNVTPRVLKAPAMNSPKLTAYNKVKVSWGAVTGAESYEVLWKQDGASEWEAKKTFDRSVVLRPLTAGRKYSIKVRAIEESEGPCSAAKSITTLKKASTPTVRRYSSTKASVRWKAVTGASGYQFYSENMKSHKGSYVTRKTTSLRSTGLYKGIKYRYKVRAYKLVDGKRVYAPWSEYRIYKHG